MYGAGKMINKDVKCLILIHKFLFFLAHNFFGSFSFLLVFFSSSTEFLITHKLSLFYKPQKLIFLSHKKKYFSHIKLDFLCITHIKVDFFRVIKLHLSVFTSQGGFFSHQNIFYHNIFFRL